MARTLSDSDSVSEMERELSRLRSCLEAEREERKKEVAALWRAVKRLSLGQSVALPRGADAIDVTAPDVNQELFPDQGDDQPDADNILQQILEGEIDPPDFSGMVAADDSLDVSWPPMNIPGKAGPLPTGNGDGLDNGVPKGEGGAPQAVGGTPGARGGAPQTEGGMPQARGGAPGVARTVGGAPQAQSATRPALGAVTGVRHRAACGGAATGPPDPPVAGVKSVLLVGDSMVYHGRFRTRDPSWSLETWAVSGGTWGEMSWSLQARVNAWARSAAAMGHTPAAVVFWLGGNDAYPRSPPVWEALSQNLEGRIGRMVASLRTRYEVYIVGPTPRPRVDGQSVWEDTRAWKLERHFAEMLREQGDVSPGRKLGKLVAVGRRLCTRQRGAVMHQGKPQDVYRVDKGMFRADGVHLTEDGYRRVSDRLPWWLRCG